MDCLFCKIANKEIASDFVYEDDKVFAFKDIKPKAKIHFLVIPKKHIDSLKDLKDENDKQLIGDLMFALCNLAKVNNLSGYKVQINVGREGGQEIDHLHLHLLSKD